MHRLSWQSFWMACVSICRLSFLYNISSVLELPTHRSNNRTKGTVLSFSAKYHMLWPWFLTASYASNAKRHRHHAFERRFARHIAVSRTWLAETLDSSIPYYRKQIALADVQTVQVLGTRCYDLPPTLERELNAQTARTLLMILHQASGAKILPAAPKTYQLALGELNWDWREERLCICSAGYVFCPLKG